jgi:hypothetical protein
MIAIRIMLYFQRVVASTSQGPGRPASRSGPGPGLRPPGGRTPHAVVRDPARVPDTWLSVLRTQVPDVFQVQVPLPTSWRR